MDLVLAATLNEARRQDLSVRALGAIPEQTDDLWRCLHQPLGPFHAAVLTSPRADPRRLRAAAQEVARAHDGPLGILDTWSLLDLSDLGFDVEERLHLSRSAGVPDRPLRPPELEISRVGTAEAIAAFDALSVAAFEMTLSGAPSEIYAPALLDDPDVHCFIGRVEGAGVAVSQAIVHAGVIGVYGVATVAVHRRRGYGEAMTWQAALVEPRLPAVLVPTVMGDALYRRMGFREIGRHRVWRRAALPA